MWGEFPGSKAVPRCMNHIKMGYPDWKRTMAELSRKELGEAAFMNFWTSQGRYPNKLVTKAWKRFHKEDFPAGSTWKEKVFNSTALLAKDVACSDQGHSGPERKLKEGESWDARNEYSLAGGTKGYTDEQHREL